MRSLLTSGGLVLAAVLAPFACGAPAAPEARSAPVVTASVGSVAAPPTPPTPAAAPAPEPVPVAGPCSGSCQGHVGPALVDAIAKRAKQAHRCYDSALATDKTLRGKVSVRMTIGVDGRVCEARAETDNKGMEAVANCVAGVYQKNTGDLRFPPPDNGCAVVNAPINFVPRADDAGAP